MEWNPAEPAWQYEILDRLRPSIDPTQLDEALRLTPSERIERLQSLLEFLEEVRRAGGDRLPTAD